MRLLRLAALGLGDGEQFAAVRRVIPDFTFRGNSAAVDLSLEVKGRDFPLGSETLLDTATIASHYRSVSPQS